MAATVQNVDVEVPSIGPTKNLANGDNNALSAASRQAMMEILSKIRPNWDAAVVEFTPLHGGITNQIVLAHIAKRAADEKAVVFRIFGNGSEKLIDRKAELETFSVMSEAGIGPRLLAKFRNGLACEYVPGATMTPAALRETPELTVKICEQIGRMNRIAWVEPTSPRYSTMRYGTKFFTSVTRWISEYEQSIRKQLKDAYFCGQGIDLYADFDAVNSRMQSQQLPLVYSHNDLLSVNMIVNEEDDSSSSFSIRFIDYEYSGMNFQFYDFGNFFWEYNETARPPSDDELKPLLRAYCAAFDKNMHVNDEQLKKMVGQVRIMEAATHLFWCSWALMQTQVSTIDFDYLAYAQLRHRRLTQTLAQIRLNEAATSKPSQMRYVSTRGEAPVLGFSDVLLAGLAKDSGLYVPAEYPQFSATEFRQLHGKSYQDVAYAVIAPYIQGDLELSDADLRVALEATYNADTFHHAAVAPLIQTATNEFVLELFHGPTLAFKDFAMQLLSRLTEHILKRRAQRVTIIGATSGDTGGAAVHAFSRVSNVDTFVLFPQGRISEVQRRQMTTAKDGNVHALAIDGSFDDCQSLVKAMFNDQAFRTEMHLAGVNSINWARILPQVVYYFWAALKLSALDQPVTFVVPTGNFGDIFAGYVAKRMGLPIEKLVIATNQNDILARTMATGRYSTRAIRHSISPSMDIQVSSNFERLLFEANGRNAAGVRRAMQELRENGEFELQPPEALRKIRAEFAAGSASETETSATIAAVFAESGYLLDPHTAVGVHVARKVFRPSAGTNGNTSASKVPSQCIVILGTAHPAKFPEAVEAASGMRPQLPPRLQKMMQAPERSVPLPADISAVKKYIRTQSTANK